MNPIRVLNTSLISKSFAQLNMPCEISDQKEPFLVTEDYLNLDYTFVFVSHRKIMAVEINKKSIVNEVKTD